MATRYTLIHSGKQATALAATAAGDKDKYLHSNASTGALEWSAVSAGSTTSFIKSFTASEDLTAGQPVGITEGETEGCPEGSADGWRDGKLVGWPEGLSLGCPDG